GLDARLSTPVIRVRSDREVIVAHPFLQRIRANADRAQAGLHRRQLAVILRSHDVYVRQPGEHQRCRGLRSDVDSVRIDDLDVIEGDEALEESRRIQRGIEDSLNRELDGLRSEGLVVAELDTLAELELPQCRRDDLPALREERLVAHLIVTHDESVEEFEVDIIVVAY